jgi:DNA-binding transcriptional ArsR family regulator
MTLRENARPARPGGKIPPRYIAKLRSASRTSLTAKSATCKFCLTDETRTKGVRALTTDQLLARLTAVGHPLRLRIIAELAGGRVHVSELARRLDMSRPLLYMHLDKLEKADMVTGHLELSDDGKAMKYFELAPFEFRINAQTVIDALREDEEKS